MVLTGKVVSKSITATGVFARVRLDCNGWPKAAMMRFFDVPDQENFEIGQKIQIDIYVAKIAAWEPDYSGEYVTLDLLNNLTEPVQRPEWCTEIGVAPIVVDETGDARFDVENVPLPEPTPENMTERSDSHGLGDRR